MQMPRRTRIIKGWGEEHGWKTVKGTWVIGHQITEQWRLRAGDEAGREVPIERLGRC